MEIRCDSCNQKFIATKAQVAQISKAKKERKSLIILKCGACHLGFAHRLRQEDAGKGEPEELLRCPVLACTGFVVQLEQKTKTVYCCGECGSTWKIAEDLFSEIEAIIKKFKYRRQAYRKSRQIWLPAGADAEPANYDELVGNEPTANPGV